MPPAALPPECAPADVALHGFVVPLPPGGEVVGTYGGWRHGHLLVAAGRQARLSVSWRRHAAAPDLARTLRRAGAGSEVGGIMGRQVGEEALDACTWLGRWDAPAGTYHALARHLPTSGLTLVLRQLAPGSGAELTTLGAAVQGVHVNQAAPWRIYGLDLELPSGWRLEGLQQLAGLVRGVWFHYGPRALRPDQALVMRRMACAGRLLGDGSMRDWVRGGLGYGERATGEHEQDGVVRVSTTAPATNWWRRWCGRHDQREIHAWRIAAGDRLMVQEWKGLGAPLPCLRGAQTAPGSSG